MGQIRQPGTDGCLTFKCATDLSSRQYRVVKLSAAWTVAACDAAGAITTIGPIGILQNAPDGSTDSELGAKVLCTPGYVGLAEAGAAISTVGRISCDSVGRVIAAADGYNILGYALETAGAAADIISVMWLPEGHDANVSLYTTGS